MYSCLDWFKENISSQLKDSELKFSFFEKGEFGDLNRVEFEYEGKGGTVDFWEKDWVEVHLYDYGDDKELIHVLLDPSQESEREEILMQLKNLLFTVQ